MGKINDKIGKVSRDYANARVKDKLSLNREACYSELVLSCFRGLDLEAAFEQGAFWALQNQWQSVDDALPPYDTDIIGMENESVYLCKRERLFDGEDVYIINDAGCFHPTHWMPIPELKMK